MATAEPPREDLIQWVRRLEARLAIVEQRSPLANTGMSVPAAGEVDVTGLLKILGDLNVTGTATIGGTTAISGATTVSGTSGIQSSNYVAGSAGWKFDGTQLEANTGVIGNGALANPVVPKALNPSATGFGLTTTWAVLASVATTVPAGMTSALVMAAGSMAAYNPNTTGGSNGTGGEYWNCQVSTSPGYGSYSYPIGVSGNGGLASAHTSVAFTLTGLTGGSTLTGQVWGSSSYQAVAANTGNKCSGAFAILWMR